ERSGAAGEIQPQGAVRPGHDDVRIAVAVPVAHARGLLDGAPPVPDLARLAETALASAGVKPQRAVGDLAREQVRTAVAGHVARDGQQVHGRPPVADADRLASLASCRTRIEPERAVGSPASYQVAVRGVRPCARTHDDVHRVPGRPRPPRSVEMSVRAAGVEPQAAVRALAREQIRPTITVAGAAESER